MITPSFKITQDNDFLFITIKAPYAKINELDIFTEENDFRFFCKPYFLRLNLPGSIKENNEDAIYDFEENFFKLKFEKKYSGEVFEGLDLVTKLLTPITNKTPEKVLIEEINNEKNENECKDEEENEDDEIEWYVDQKENTIEDEIQFSTVRCKYGFAQTKSKVFSKLSEEYLLVVDIQNPDNNTEDRTVQRVNDENQKFNDDHYLADYFDDTGILEGSILQYTPSYDKDYDDVEIDILKNLPKRTYMLDKEEKFYAFSGLIDILFAYCYNKRINCGEINVESGWTIAKLSSTLSWFDTFKTLQDVIVTSYRRSLCFPLYRNWKLTEIVFNDLIGLLKIGIKQIIKALIETRKLFLDKCDNRYILNDLYINDYLVWIQYVSNKKLASLVSCIENIKVTKQMVNFDLECLEICGQLAIESENRSESETDSDNITDSSSDQDDDDENSSNLEFDLSTLNLGTKNNENNKKPKIIELN